MGGALPEIFTNLSDEQIKIPQQMCDDKSIAAPKLSTETKLQGHQRRHPGFPAPKKFKVILSARKVFTSVLWGAEDVLRIENLRSVSRMTGSYYSDLITTLRAAIDKKRREKLR